MSSSTHNVHIQTNNPPGFGHEGEACTSPSVAYTYLDQAINAAKSLIKGKGFGCVVVTSDYPLHPLYPTYLGGMLVRIQCITTLTKHTETTRTNYHHYDAKHLSEHTLLQMHSDSDWEKVQNTIEALASIHGDVK